MRLSVDPERVAAKRDEAEAEPLSPKEAVRIVLGIPRKAARARKPDQSFAVCEVCGQIFDERDDGQRAHHVGGEHEPLLSSPAGSHT